MSETLSKIDVSDTLVFESESQFRSFTLKKTICSKKIVVFTKFSTVFHCFPHFFQTRIAFSLFRSQKTRDSHEKPKSEVPILLLGVLLDNIQTLHISQTWKQVKDPPVYFFRIWWERNRKKRGLFHAFFYFPFFYEYVHCNK